jgi:hypothetical protein
MNSPGLSGRTSTNRMFLKMLFVLQGSGTFSINCILFVGLLCLRTALCNKSLGSNEKNYYELNW